MTEGVASVVELLLFTDVCNKNALPDLPPTRQALVAAGLLWA
jgi:hypothetical protein